LKASQKGLDSCPALNNSTLETYPQGSLPVQELELVEESKAWWLMTWFCTALHWNRVTAKHDFSHL